MTDKYPGLFDGSSRPDTIIINLIADEAILIGSPVIPVAAATGELDVRVEPSTDGSLSIEGVVAGGDNNGIWVDGTTANDGNAAAAAGEAVKVVTHGRVKVRVDGSTGGANSNIAIGDPLSCAATDGIAQRAVSGDYVFGRAKQASTAVGDAILCEVTLEGIL